MKNHGNVLKICLFFQNTKQPLSISDLCKTQKSEQLCGLSPDPVCLLKLISVKLSSVGEFGPNFTVKTIAFL